MLRGFKSGPYYLTQGSPLLLAKTTNVYPPAIECSGDVLTIVKGKEGVHVQFDEGGIMEFPLGKIDYYLHTAKEGG